MSVHEWNVGWIARKWAEVQPKKTALIFEDRVITYQELNNGANRVAHYLRQNGIKKGKPQNSEKF